MGFCDPKKWISRKLGPNYKKNLHFSHCVTFFFSRMWKLWWPILYIPLWIRSEAFKFYFHCLPSWIYPLLSLQPRTKPQMTNPSLPQPLAQSLELRELRIRAYGIIFFLFLFPNITTLQELSKCEVKAWLWRCLIILPTLRFHVKSNLGEFKRSKNVIFANFRDSELSILVNLGLESCSNLLKIKI